MVSPILAKWHKVWDAKSRWEPSIEEKIQNCTLQAPENDTSNTSTRPLTSFRLFPNLLPELRAQIWEMALPGPRCMQVHPTHYRPPGYKAFPHCYGAQNPVILSVNRESRAEALRHLTLRFSTYWNLKIDTLYLEDVQGEKQRPVEQLKCIREGGLLDGFKHLALHEWMWGSAVPEQCISALRLLPQLETCSIVMRYRNYHDDVLDRGKSWYLLPVESKDQTEFPMRRDWDVREQQLRKRIEGEIREDKGKHELEWKNRGPGPKIQFRVIEGRKMQARLMWRSPEGPGEDWFG